MKKLLKKLWPLFIPLIVQISGWRWKELLEGKLPLADFAVTLNDAYNATGVAGFLILLLYLFALSAGEELVFRGAVQWGIGKLTDNLYIIVGVAASSFALLHLMNGHWLQVGWALFFGVYFGSLRVEGMKLWALCLLHWLMNTSAIFVDESGEGMDWLVLVVTAPMFIDGLLRIKRLQDERN